ncbi:MAG: DUF6077 domain-containing protein [Acidobacteriota bacterium]|nr:DUF6077 domain-containing protein [Acidobacteriota bacterium]
MKSFRKNFDGFLRWTCDGFVVVFGLWSVLSQAVALLGGSPRLLGRLSLLVPLPAAALLLWIGRSSSRARAGEDLQPQPPLEPRLRPPHFPALVGAAVLAAFYALTGSYVVFWTAACLLLGYYYLRCVRAPRIRLDGSAAPEPLAAELAILALLAVVVLAATLFVHRPQLDDSLYVGVATDVWDHPGEPIMGRDTMHGVPGLPFVSPQHRVRTYDVLVGLVSRALGIKPMAAAHLLFPPLFGLLFLAAASRLLRLLLGRAWLFGLAAVVVLLLVDGETVVSLGNSAFVALFQGKAVLPTIMVPLLAVYGLELVSGFRPAPVMIGLIGLGWAGSVSLSTNGIFLGPITVGLASAAAWRPDRRSTIRLLEAVLVCLLPVGLGLFLRRGSVPEAFYMTSAIRSSWLYVLKWSLNWSWGGSLFQPFWLMALLGGWAFLPDSARRRWMLGYSWLFLLLCMNPLLTPFWARYVTSSISLFRLFWAVPLPFFLAALLTGPLFAGSRRWKPGLRPALMGLVLLGFALFVPEQWAISRRNGAALDWPRLKAVPNFYETAERMVAATPRGGTVLAPEAVSAWIPTIPGHPPAYAVRRMFLDQFGLRLPPGEYIRRVTLLDYVSGDRRRLPKEEMNAYFGAAIDDWKIRSVAILRSNRWLADIENFLRGRGFRRIESPSRFFRIFIDERNAEP